VAHSTGPAGKADVHVLDVGSDNKLSNQKVFTDCVVDGVKCGPDGVRCDVYGNVWISSNAGRAVGYSGVTVWNLDGKLIGRIRLPEVCGNICFGGPKRNRLFMVASSRCTPCTRTPRGPRLVDDAVRLRSWARGGGARWRWGGDGGAGAAPPSSASVSFELLSGCSTLQLPVAIRAPHAAIEADDEQAVLLQFGRADQGSNAPCVPV
jgi:hypothetical protein